MKVSAHPMMVAVALGLLGPASLAMAADDAEPRPCEDCDDEGTSTPLFDLRLSEATHEVDMAPTSTAYWEEVHAPSEADRAAVAAAWAELS